MNINYHDIDGALCLTKKEFVSIAKVPLGTLDSWIGRKQIVVIRIGNIVLIPKNEVEKRLKKIKKD